MGMEKHVSKTETHMKESLRMGSFLEKAGLFTKTLTILHLKLSMKENLGIRSVRDMG